MRNISGVLFFLISMVILHGGIAFGGEKVNYFIEGIKFRGEGRCEEAIRSYQTARRLRQFKEDWSYHLAVADCYVVLKKYDDAVDAYTRVIDATKNKSLQAEMYKGRGRAYYLKAVKADALDRKYLELAKKDLDNAKALGADTAEIEKSMAADLALKTVVSDAVSDMQTMSPQTVAVIEGPNRIVTGDGSSVLFLSGDTVIKDKSGQAVPSSEIRPGDSIEFSCTSSYLNRADGMSHCAAKEVTLNRNAQARTAASDVSGKTKDEGDNTLYLRLITQRLDRMDKDIRELKEKTTQSKKMTKPAKPKQKKKRIEKKPAEPKPAAGTEPEKEPAKKPSEW